MMNCNKYVRAAILALVISSASRAEAVVIGGTIPATPVSLTGSLSGGVFVVSDEPFSLPKFDSHLGTLSGVSLTLHSFVDNSFHYSNIGALNPNPNVSVTFTRYLNFGDTISAGVLSSPSTACASALAVCEKNVPQSETFTFAQGVDATKSLAQQEVGGSFSFSSGLDQFIGSGLATDTKTFYFSSRTNFITSDLGGGSILSNTAAYTPSIQYSYSYVAAVPEPEIYAMMLAGLGLIGFLARRRKQTEAVAA